MKSGARDQERRKWRVKREAFQEMNRLFFLSEIVFIGLSSIKILPMKIRLFPTVPRIPKKWEEKDGKGS